MSDRSRELKEPVIRGLAKVGLLWAVAVLAAVFMVMGSQGQEAASASFVGSSLAVPRTAGLALVLLLLAGGLTVLAIGSSRGDIEPRYRPEPQPEPEADLSLALGLGIFA